MSRRGYPIMIFVVGVAFVVVVGWLGPRLDGLVAGVAFISIGVVTAGLSYLLGRHPRPVPAVIGLIVLTAAAEGGWTDPFPAMVTVGFFLVGRIVLGHRTVARRLRARAFELNAERERYVEEAVRLERARIACDLHDVVAHRMSVIVIQASAAQRSPAAANGTADIIVRMTRAADAELASLTQVLAPDAPVPRRRLDDLLAGAVGAGARLDCDIAGGVTSIPAVAYRVVQEGLTNAMRYAPGAPITVAVASTGDVRIEVINRAPRESPAPGMGGGYGLISLTERVNAAGGTLHSRPTADGGWELRAIVPG
jgi:signal transduction histidine kinase